MEDLEYDWGPIDDEEEEELDYDLDDDWDVPGAFAAFCLWTVPHGACWVGPLDLLKGILQNLKSQLNLESQPDLE